jgi:hypothetical protein
VWLLLINRSNNDASQVIRWALSDSVLRRVSWWQRDTMRRYIHCVTFKCLPDMVTREYSYFFLKPIVASVSSLHPPRYWEGGRMLLKGMSILIPRTSVIILHVCLDNAKEEIMIDARFSSCSRKAFYWRAIHFKSSVSLSTAVIIAIPSRPYKHVRKDEPIVA